MRNYKSLFPNSFTMGNMLCGFISILQSFDGNAKAAAWFIVLGAFLDSLDGTIARLSKVSSRFGVELDSLADFLTFGVATGVLLHAFKFSTFLGRWGFIVPVVFVMCSAYRLARFNLLADLEKKEKFLGLPVPVASLLLVSYVIFSYKLWGGIEYGQFLISMVGVVSILMVSTVTYETFPVRLNTSESKLKFLLLFVFIIALIVKPEMVLFPALLIYVLGCLLREVITMLRSEQRKVRQVRNLKKKSVSDDESEDKS